MILSFALPAAATVAPTRLHVWSKAERHQLRVAFQSYGRPATQDEWSFLAGVSGVHTTTVEQIREDCEELYERAVGEAEKKKKSAGGAAPAKKGGAYDDDELTPQISKTILARVELFAALRKIECTPATTNRIAEANLSPMTNWWGAPYDMALLEYAQKNGAVKKAWDDVLSVPNEFSKGTSDPKEQMQRTSFVQSFFTSKVNPIFDRLELIKKACLN